MDEKELLETFARLKVLTIDQLVYLLHCSVITVRRRLKKWKCYTSINQNGRYYSLPQTPVFDDKGLWRHQSILFSKHGNLKETILCLIRQSEKGLSAAEIAQLLDLSPTSSFFTQVYQSAGIKREKHRGRFIYFSDSSEGYKRQQEQRSFRRPGVLGWPTDSQAVAILVELIKHPGIDVLKLASKVSRHGYSIDPSVIEAFLRSHDLLKKTPDIER